MGERLRSEHLHVEADTGRPCCDLPIATACSISPSLFCRLEQDDIDEDTIEHKRRYCPMSFYSNFVYDFMCVHYAGV